MTVGRGGVSSSRRTLAAAMPLLALARAARSQAPDPGIAARANLLGARLLAALDLNREAVVVSPLSLLDATALLIPGARGPTATGFETLLGPDPQAAYAALHAQLAGAASLRRGSAAWLSHNDGGALPAYRAALAALGTDITTVDFADPRTLALINGWVAERTGNLIPTLLDSLPPDVALVLTAALYFAADWSEPFDARLTVPRRFRRAAGGAVELPFVNGTRPAAFAEGDGIHAVRLRYVTPDFELVLVAPRAGGSPLLVRNLVAQARLQPAIAGLGFVRGPVRIAFPRFEIGTTAELAEPLRRLSPVYAEEADYGGIIGRQVGISQIRQKAVLKVDEQGTVAAAATGIVLGTRGLALQQPPSFTADAPFWAGLIHVPSGVQVVSALINLPKSG